MKSKYIFYLLLYGQEGKFYELHRLELVQPHDLNNNSEQIQNDPINIESKHLLRVANPTECLFQYVI